jgi:hypothetical protein
MPRRALVALALAALLLPALVACGGGEPATMAALPVFPEAAELQAGEDAMADAVAGSLQSSVGGNLTAEVKLYRLPEDTSWEQVRAFYTDALGDTDWKATSELDSANEALSTAGWQRGGGAGEQVLMVGFVPALLDGGPVAIVSLFSE